jgi:hypothetical protein
VLHGPIICVCARLLHTITRDPCAHARFSLYIFCQMFFSLSYSEVLANELKFHLSGMRILTCYFIYVVGTVQHACMLRCHVGTLQNLVGSEINSGRLGARSKQ